MKLALKSTRLTEGKEKNSVFVFGCLCFFISTGCIPAYYTSILGFDCILRGVPSKNISEGANDEIVFQEGW